MTILRKNESISSDLMTVSLHYAGESPDDNLV